LAGRTYSVRAIAFDLDGVLIDTETINVTSALDAFAHHGHALDPGAAADIVGRHPDDYGPVLARRFGVPDHALSGIRTLQQELYDRRCREGALLKEGAAEVLELFASRGLPLALATSSSRREVEEVFVRFPIGRYFAITLTKDDVTRRKPDPEMYLTCATRLAVEPRAMLVVEDSEYGVRAAKAAGAPCVAVRTPHTPPERLAGADSVIDSLHELVALVERDAS
jgi:HAD superfamily hydrolase (TIGR01509 family)